MICQLLMTGNELMTGITIDSNSAFIAEQLHTIGISVKKIITVGDCLADLEQEILDASRQSDLLIINGGLGPTDDDLTAAALARAFQKPLQNHHDAEQHIRHWCSSRNLAPNRANLKQALLPEGSTIISNLIGSAVGINMEIKHGEHTCIILCTPGVPGEMRLMFQEKIIPQLKTRFPDSQERFIKRLQVFGMGESSIQQKIHNGFPDWPNEIELGFRAGMPALEVKLTVNHKKYLSLRDHWEKKLHVILGHHLFGEEDDTLQSVTIKALQQQNKILTTAESCTGGLVSSLITSVAGSSKVFECGFVTYSNEIKHRILGVGRETLSQYGAVSKEVVLQMAQGALEKSKADYALAISGIAGPDGGTTEKPVGTAWIAWGKSGELKTQKLFYPAERKTFQLLVAAYGLDLIRRDVLQITESPRYIKQ